MKANHGCASAVLARWIVCALALAYVQVGAWAATSGNIGRANISGNGNSVRVTQATTNAGGSTIPVSPSVGGWTQAGNYGVPPAATGTTMNRTINGETVISGQRYPFQAGYGTPWKDLVGPAAQALGTVGCSMISSGILTVACVAAVPYIYDWITKAGGRRNPQTGQLERQDPAICTVAPCFAYDIYQPSVAPDIGEWFDTKAAACTRLAERLTGVSATYVFTVASVPASGTPCIMKMVLKSNGTVYSQGDAYGVAASRSAPPKDSNWLPSSMDDIAPYMRNVTPDGRIVGDILGPGQGSIPDSVPTVTGPSSIQGPASVTTNADGTKTASSTTYNFTTNGNTITNTSNVTTTNNYNAAGAVTNTTTRTDTPAPSSTTTGTSQGQPGEPQDVVTQCDKFPESLGCATLDTPTGIIPKETKTITYAEESVLGGGSCPADVMWSPHSIAGTYKFIDWQQACGWAAQLKWIVLLLATWAAFWIVMPGNTQVKPQ